MSRFEQTFFSYFSAVRDQLKIQPLLLGGGSGANGGSGGPPGGFIGQLPQNKVSYDTTEAESLFTPASGASLLHNLNHIRYRLSSLELTTSGISIKNDGNLVDSGITVIDFEHPLYVNQVSENEVVVSLSGEINSTSYSGVWNEDLSSQANGSNTTFDTEKYIYDTSTRVFLNGLRKDPNDVSIFANHLGFELDSPPASGTVVVVDYETPVNTPGHDHPLYRLISDSYSASETNSLFSSIVHTHVEADITDLVHNALFINSVPVSGVPVDGQVLMYDAGDNIWFPQTVPGLSTLTVKQQMLLTINGTLTTTGVSPIAIYAHDVNATIDEILITLYTVPGSTPVRVNVLKNGSTILNSPNYIQVDIGAFSESITSFADNTFTKDDKFEINLVQGDTNASYLVVHIRFSYDL